jgi:hypothetical protein
VTSHRIRIVRQSRWHYRAEREQYDLDKGQYEWIDGGWAFLTHWGALHASKRWAKRQKRPSSSDIVTYTLRENGQVQAWVGR